MGSRLVWIVLALVVGYEIDRPPPEVTLGVSPNVTRMSVRRDGDDVVLTLDATTGKSISWPISPDEARGVADLLYECADDPDENVRHAPIDL